MMFNDRNFKVAGGPTHRGGVYLRRLVAAGHKVGLVRQTETAALKAAGEGKSKLFERRVCAVYTRATLGAAPAIEGASEPAEAEAEAGAGAGAGAGSYLVTIVEAGGGGSGAEMAVVAVDCSTGRVAAGCFRDGPLRSVLEGHLLVLQPGEVLLAAAAGRGAQPALSPPTEKLVRGLCGGVGGARLERLDVTPLEHGGALAELTALVGEGGDGARHTQALLALPDLLHLALAATRRHLLQFGLTAPLARAAEFEALQAVGRMRLPPNALRQLALLSTDQQAGDRGSLLWLLDHTRSAGGRRALHSWVASPLTCREAIEQRLDAVQALSRAADDPGLLSLIPGLFRPKPPDCGRALARALHHTATPGEFVSALTALAQRSEAVAEAMGEEAEEEGRLPPLLARLLAALGAPEVGRGARALLRRLDPEAAAAHPPQLERLFRPAEEAEEAMDVDGEETLTFPAVDAARAAIAAADGALAALLPALRQQLKLSRPLEYTKVGDAHHLIELPADMPVPPGWLRHSTVNAKQRGAGKVNRWAVPAVQREEEARERGSEQLLLAARAAWRLFLDRFGAHYGPMREAAEALGQLDALLSLAQVARLEGYVRPRLAPPGAPPQLAIVAGRHPMLDAVLNGGFIANDCLLGGGSPRCLVVTGPNMGGKSSFIRASALIALMAHMGSFVPAAECTLSVMDGVQARMGAADSLATGASTFLEEMTECSAILRTASARSLVILDELGRGTATEDGLAIAHAALEHLARGPARPLVLFVTHFPSLARDLPRAAPDALRAAYVSYAAEGAGEEAGRQADVTFLFKLLPGVAGSSFGLNVARMAGLPPAVLARAAAKAEEAEAAASGGLTPHEVAELTAALRAMA